MTTYEQMEDEYLAEINQPDRDIRDTFRQDISENPNDDDLKKVYADYLTEQSDPRGEFILLQCLRAEADLSEFQAQRERNLQRKYARKWLGTVAHLSGSPSWKFEKGFLVSCRFNPRMGAFWRQVRGHPEWCYIREIRSHRSYIMGIPHSLLTHPIMASLRTALFLTPRNAYEVMNHKGELPLEALGVSWGFGQRENFTAEHFKKLGLSRGLPNLKRLLLSSAGPVEPSELDWLWNSPLAKRLELLKVSHHHAELDDWFRKLDRTDPPIGAVCLYNYSYHVTISRGKDDKFSELDLRITEPSSDRDRYFSLVPEFRSLPPDTVTKLTVRFPDARHKDLYEKAFSRQKKLTDARFLEQPRQKFAHEPQHARLPDEINF